MDKIKPHCWGFTVAAMLLEPVHILAADSCIGINIEHSAIPPELNHPLIDVIVTWVYDVLDVPLSHELAQSRCDVVAHSSAPRLRNNQL